MLRPFVSPRPPAPPAAPGLGPRPALVAALVGAPALPPLRPIGLRAIAPIEFEQRRARSQIAPFIPLPTTPHGPAGVKAIT